MSDDQPVLDKPTTVEYQKGSEVTIQIIGDKKFYDKVKLPVTSAKYALHIITEKDKIECLILGSKTKIFMIINPELKSTEFKPLVDKYFVQEKLFVTCTDEEFELVKKPLDLKFEPTYSVDYIDDGFEDEQEQYQKQSEGKEFNKVHELNEEFDDVQEYICTNADKLCEEMWYGFMLGGLKAYAEITEAEKAKRQEIQKKIKEKKQQKKDANQEKKENTRKNRPQKEDKTEKVEKKEKKQEEIDIKFDKQEKPEKKQNENKREYENKRENKDKHEYKDKHENEHKYVRISDEEYVEILKKNKYNKGIFLSQKGKKELTKIDVFNIMNDLAIDELKTLDINGKTIYLLPLNKYVQLEQLNQNEDVFYRLIKIEQ
ncbi:Hypothetical_protein [Hexamita inflata]|uniref:Hypothetical_protein n=1 Tax=Hexamita inflata TaxID=28002 RepID=A0AA86RFI0_9EUKA|nr:Hypothetical protein HINF_LOCUS63162 [Hexamita inflata]